MKVWKGGGSSCYDAGNEMADIVSMVCGKINLIYYVHLGGGGRSS